MATLDVIIITAALPWIVGVPFAALAADRGAAGRDAASIDLWLLAPLLGLAVLILVPQNFFYLGLPLPAAVLGIAGATGLAWTAVLLIRPRAVTVRNGGILLGVLGLVYLCHGTGLMFAGVDDFMGRAWHDQFNYVSLAELVRRGSVSTTFCDVVGQPHLVAGVATAQDRIGQSVLEAVIAVIARISTRESFMPTILLVPLLVASTLFWGSRRFGFSPRFAALAAVTGACLPGLASVYLESFFSQAMVIPFLLGFPFVAAGALDTGKWTRSLAAAVVLAAGASVYAEFVPLFLGCLAVTAAAAAVRQQTLSLPARSWHRFRHPRWRPLAVAPVIPVLALALNPFYLQTLLDIMGRVGTFGVLGSLYPWARSAEGIARLWLWDLADRTAPDWSATANGIALALTMVAGGGLILCAIRRRIGPAGLGMLALTAVPLALFFMGKGYSYQFYKVWLSLCPLLGIGIAAAVEALLAAGPAPPPPNLVPLGHRLARPAGGLVAALAVVLPLLVTAHLSWRAAGGAGLSEQAVGRGGAFKLLDQETRELRRRAESLRGTDVYIVYYDDFFGGNFRNAWISYFFRFNRVWVGNPALNDRDLRSIPCYDRILPAPFAPRSGFTVLSSTPLPQLAHRLAWQGGSYFLYDCPPEDWPVFLQDLPRLRQP